MLRNLQKFAKPSFTIATILLMLGTIQAWITYMEVYTAVRALDFSTTELTIRIFSETDLEISNTLTLKNPSQKVFNALGVEQSIFLNGQSMVYKRPEEPSRAKPVSVLPNSSMTVEIRINATVSPEVTEALLDSQRTNKWFYRIYMFLEGPLIGQFSLNVFREPQAVIINET